MEKCNFLFILIYFVRKYSLLTLSIFSKTAVSTNTEISVALLNKIFVDLGVSKMFYSSTKLKFDHEDGIGY